MNVQEYQAAQAAIAVQTEEKVAALYGVFATAGEPLSRDEFATYVGVIVANANTRAAVLADVFQNARLRKSPQGVGRPPAEPKTLADAVAGLLVEGDDPLPRLRRLAKTEPVQASRQTARDVLAHNSVRSYRWVVSSKEPCGLCRFLARRAWPVKKVPYSHPGCSCQVVPA